MAWSIDIEPRGRGTRELLEVFTREQTVFAKDLLRIVSKSSFYESFLPFVERVNAQVQAHLDGGYLLRAEYKRDPVTGRYAVALCRHPHVRLHRDGRAYKITASS